MSNQSKYDGWPRADLFLDNFMISISVAPRVCCIFGILGNLNNDKLLPMTKWVITNEKFYWNQVFSIQKTSKWVILREKVVT